MPQFPAGTLTFACILAQTQASVPSPHPGVLAHSPPQVSISSYFLVPVSSRTQFPSSSHPLVRFLYSVTETKH